MRGPLKPVAISVILIGVLLAILWWPSGDRASDSGEPLLFYCAAGIQNPVQEIADAYSAEYGVPVRLEYAGSGTLLSKLRVAAKGDLYLAGDSTYVDIGREQGVLAESIPVASMRPVIAVPKGNPQGIAHVQDLAREGIRAALGAPEAASIGKQGKALLESIGAWDHVSEAVRARGVFKPTVNEIANDVKIGAVDAGIVWDVTVRQYPELEAVAIEGADRAVQSVTIAVLTASEQPTAALRFARYLTARDRGLPIFEKHGFPVASGDVWAETPEILYFSGGVNRVAIEDTLKTFQEREGCVIKTVYNGCGILVGQMKLGERPDVYHSCDISFMRDIVDLFAPAVNVSSTPMVIVAAKGNPLGIEALEDLGREGLRIGLANEQQSALGALTARLLRQQGFYDAVTKNVVATTPTADLLVNQISTGALDAVVVYEANTTYQRDALDIIPIDTQYAVAIQTYAIGKQSAHQQLTARLLDRLESSESRERYAETGFREAAHHE
ncbi:MAG: solute-binding protein [bacterium]|nr:solute-binding protein [bacterium]